MSDLISRSALIKRMKSGCDMQDLYYPIHFLDFVEDAPTVEGRARGEWLYVHETINTCSAWMCDNCKKTFGLPFVKEEYKYCPECGAKMEVKPAIGSLEKAIPREKIDHIIKK